MARYYDMDKLKALIEAKADTLVEGKEAFLYVAKWLDLLPHEDVAPVHHAYWKVVTVIKEDCACGSNRLMQYKVCSHCEQPMGVCGTDYCGHCGAIMDGFVLEGHSDPTGHDGPCGEPGMDAVTFAKREVAREIEALGNEVGKIYNHYVFEDTDYADDDVAVEAAMNALTEVLNLIAEFKNKYTEE